MDNPNHASSESQPLSVSQLTEQVKGLLEGEFPSVWVAGEISNFSRARSGHCYFTLKDEGAQLRTVIWQGTASRVRFEVADGLEVVCRGHLDVYAPRGSYQLVVEQIEPKGVGALELALRRLRDKFAAEGLFDPERKKPLPAFPKQIALVTSPTGAAIHDFLQVLGRRWRGVSVLVVPTRVQGEGASKEIAAAIATVNRLAVPIDVLVVTRGGGSLEDLWAFNEEPVVRAIAASRIPVVSAVGHEIDVTLSDLVADMRALTPSEAAERIVPAAEEVAATLRSHAQRLHAAARGRTDMARNRLDAIAQTRVFRRPLDRVYELGRMLDDLTARGRRGMGQVHTEARGRADALAGKLESLSPLAVLGRGYSLTEWLDDDRLICDASELSVGDQLSTRFATGRATSTVDRVWRSSVKT